MALSIEQIAAVSYPAVLAELRKPANQWAENAALRVMEKMGFIKRMNFGENIEVPLDYRPNPDIAVLVNDEDEHTLLKTEVITSALYEIAQISEPVKWTKFDDLRNQSETQKIDFVKHLLTNAIDSHDDLVEQLIFTSSTAGGVEVNGLDVLVPTSGLGSPGGISATTETFWRNHADTYLADGSDIEAVFTEAYNECLKGSGSSLGPKLLLGGSDPHVLYESQLQALQRYNSSDTGDGGFKALKFKGIDFIFSQYGGDPVYFLNPKSYNLCVSKEYFRDKQATETVQGQNAFYFLVYSALQFVTNNKSRLAVVTSA